MRITLGTHFLLALILLMNAGCSEQQPNTLKKRIAGTNAEAERVIAEAKAFRERWNQEHGCTDADSTSGWNVQRCTDKMDGSRTISLMKGDVVIRCKSGKTDAFVNVGTQIQPEYGMYGENHHVRVKFDSGKPALQLWLEGTNGTALFSRDPRTLSKQLAHAKTFYFEYTPFQEGSRVLEFDVSG